MSIVSTCRWLTKLLSVPLLSLRRPHGTGISTALRPSIGSRPFASFCAPTELDEHRSLVLLAEVLIAVPVDRVKPNDIFGDVCADWHNRHFDLPFVTSMFDDPAAACRRSRACQMRWRLSSHYPPTSLAKIFLNSVESALFLCARGSVVLLCSKLHRNHFERPLNSARRTSCAR